MENKNIDSIKQDCLFWKERALFWKNLAKKREIENIDCQKEINKLVEETHLLERKIEMILFDKDLKTFIEKEKIENLKKQLKAHEKYSKMCENETKELLNERDALMKHVRELEQSNDNLERVNREVDESVLDIETSLEQAYEKNAILESEIDEKDQLQLNIQHLNDEVRDLKQELKLRTLSDSIKNKSENFFTNVPVEVNENQDVFVEVNLNNDEISSYKEITQSNLYDNSALKNSMTSLPPKSTYKFNCLKFFSCWGI